MSNRPYDREAWNPRERPLSTDNNQEASYSDQALRELLTNLLNSRVSAADDTANTTPPTGFLGEGFKARPGGGLSVTLSRGLGFFGDTATATAIGGLVGVDDLQRFKPVPLNIAENIIVPPNVSGNPRIDIVEVKYRRALIDSTARDIMSLVAPFPFVSTLVNKTLTWALDGQQGTVATPAPSTAFIGYVQGIPAGVPAAPPVTAGYEKIAQIAVASGAGVINTADIQDHRRILAPYGNQQISVEVTSLIGVHNITNLIAPPGVEVTVANAGAGAAANRFLLTIKAGKLPLRVMGTINMTQLGAVGIHSYISAIAISAPLHSVLMTCFGFGLTPVTPPGPLAYGTTALGTVISNVIINYQQ